MAGPEFNPGSPKYVGGGDRYTVTLGDMKIRYHIMKHPPLLEAQILRLLWNSKIHYRVHKSQLLDLNRLNPVHTLAAYLSKSYFNTVPSSTFRSHT
jgi:hypothetical protein